MVKLRVKDMRTGPAAALERGRKSHVLSQCWIRCGEKSYWNTTPAWFEDPITLHIKGMGCPWLGLFMGIISCLYEAGDGVGVESGGNGIFYFTWFPTLATCRKWRWWYESATLMIQRWLLYISLFAHGLFVIWKAKVITLQLVIKLL